MKRPRRRRSQERCVKLVIDILEKEIGPRFNSRKNLSKHGIHRQVNNKYHKMLFRIVEYLENLRGSHKNKIEDLIRDYLTSVYEYYQGFRRIPSVTQLSPSPSNQIRFEEWIYELAREHDEGYWTYEQKRDELYEIIEVPIEPIDIELNFTET